VLLAGGETQAEKKTQRTPGYNTKKNIIYRPGEGSDRKTRGGRAGGGKARETGHLRSDPRQHVGYKGEGEGWKKSKGFPAGMTD